MSDGMFWMLTTAALVPVAAVAVANLVSTIKAYRRDKARIVGGE